jgi:prepilin-type N-terminal cleavage/methylation domain-containing protein/prepilin-type processing-associated H-X9-DG protein
MKEKPYHSARHPKSSPKGPETTSQPGFTLIELLAVITIIGILAALTVVGVNRALVSARSSHCLSNLRQIGTAIHLYANDHSGAFPPKVLTTSGGQTLTFPDLIIPYLTANDAHYSETERRLYFACPSASEDDFAISDYTANERWTANDVTGVFARQGWGVNIPAVRMSDIRHPDRVYALMDGFEDGDITHGSWSTGKQLYTGTAFGATAPDKGPAPRHFSTGKYGEGQFNVLYCDGHAEALDFSDPRLRDDVFRKAMCTP